MPRYFLEIRFDGTPYRGWQNQPVAPSVQAEVERALATALHQQKVNAVGCGRTDTGVHAHSFFLHFDAEADDLGDRFTNSLNGLLPESIAVMRILRVPDDAHARFSATARTYTYQVHRQKDPFLTGRSWYLRAALDVERMNEACKAILGEQDFSGFQKTGSDNRTSRCHVHGALWTGDGPHSLFTITADRYLRNMVRAIVGSCVRVGQGMAGVDELKQILDSRDRGRAGKSAPANGLYLERIAYPFIPA
ncbi:MAG: tRNA pseudouridine(38-40) synthase TruA [Flavobacteriales bacterium]|nr:tRNA pseudouridine(38-40) synthase TruA [Flavobacteriales bacterium]